MLLISHRGNLSGPVLETENTPTQIDIVIKLGFDVEIDIWYINQTFYLGHDEPKFKVGKKWINDRKSKLWIHCKNTETLIYMKNNNTLHYFWHENDTLTLTSQNFIWAFPGKQPIKNSIAVMPELYKDDLSQCIGICSDYIQNYKK